MAEVGEGRIRRRIFPDARMQSKRTPKRGWEDPVDVDVKKFLSTRSRNLLEETRAPISLSSYRKKMITLWKILVYVRGSHDRFQSKHFLIKWLCRQCKYRQLILKQRGSRVQYSKSNHGQLAPWFDLYRPQGEVHFSLSRSLLFIITILLLNRHSIQYDALQVYIVLHWTLHVLSVMDILL